MEEHLQDKINDLKEVLYFWEETPDLWVGMVGRGVHRRAVWKSGTSTWSARWSSGKSRSARWSFRKSRTSCTATTTTTCSPSRTSGRGRSTRWNFKIGWIAKAGQKRNLAGLWRLADSCPTDDRGCELHLSAMVGSSYDCCWTSIPSLFASGSTHEAPDGACDTGHGPWVASHRELGGGYAASSRPKGHLRGPCGEQTHVSGSSHVQAVHRLPAWRTSGKNFSVTNVGGLEGPIQWRCRDGQLHPEMEKVDSSCRRTSISFTRSSGFGRRSQKWVMH